MGNYFDFNITNAFSSDNIDAKMNINVHLPEEIVIHILSYLPPEKLLKSCLVCKDWNALIKSRPVWCKKYKHKYNSKPPNFSWYVFYALFKNEYLEVNLIKNPCAIQKFKHWQVLNSFGDGFAIEDTPHGSSPLPIEVMNTQKTPKCFVTSYAKCCKTQVIPLNSLCRKILNELKPEIHVSEWVTSRFDCASKYKMTVCLYGSDKKQAKKISIEEKHLDAGAEWEKVEIVIKDYPKNIEQIVFSHEGQDRQFWAGHYGSKMTGAQVIIKII